MELPGATLKELAGTLKMPETTLGKFAAPVRAQSMSEAMGWAKGPSQTERYFHELYTYDIYSVGVEKPGKEAAPDYDRCRTKDGLQTNNPNDMLPCVYVSGKKRDRDLTFVDIFEQLERMMREDQTALELIGCLLFRSGFMLDHANASTGGLRYHPPAAALRVIEERMPEIGGLPAEVFLYYLDVLALNEDVKYETLGYNVATQGYGRRNNLLTCAHLIAVLLNRASLFKFAGSLARPPPGVAPMAQKAGREYFPLLDGRID